MRIDALLLTRDFILQRIVERSAQEFAVDPELHTSGQKALQRVAEWKFAAIIADCEHDGGMSLLQAMRLEPRNRNSIAIAVVPPRLSLGVPFRSGANFVVEKPVTRERVSRLLRAAYGLMAREHYRYLRHALEVPVTALFGSGASVQARSRNVSTRGLSVQSNVSPPWPSCVRLQFKLSGSSVPIDADAEVIWSDTCGRAGLRMLNFHNASQREFDSWMTARTEFLSSGGLLRPPLPHRAEPAVQGYLHAACS